MRQVELIFSAIGTEGDLLPVVATAGALRRRGFASHVLATEAAAPWAREQGLRFTAIAPPAKDNLIPLEERLDHFVVPSFAPSRRCVEDSMRDGKQPILVNLSEASAAPMLAERYRLPLFRLELQPYGLPSLLAPPWPFAKALFWLGAEEYRRHTLPAVYRQRYEHPYLLSFCRRSIDFARSSGSSLSRARYPCSGSFIDASPCFPNGSTDSPKPQSERSEAANRT